ncbi:MAG: hypothetical protein M1820_000441 [Bogoriella megaspora]|nr:MAG: hypothetical protein M1820_000441 [Bogoriella megaspora]
MSSSGGTLWLQRTVNLPSQGRGVHLIDKHITSAIPELSETRVGILHLFVQHTSCALSLNENWDPEVRLDMSDALDRIVPEEGSRVGDRLAKEGSGRANGKDAEGKKASGADLYRHSAEGSDDMPAHVKAALVGASVSVPVTEGRLATGTWQGLYLMEFRDAKQSRRVVATLQGERK